MLFLRYLRPHLLPNLFVVRVRVDPVLLLLKAKSARLQSRSGLAPGNVFVIQPAMASSTLPKLPVALPELPAFIDKHPETPVADVVDPYVKYEAHLRRLYAQQP